MTGAPPLTSPGSRIVASWWRQLTPWKPRSLWMGLLLLHRVEAPVRIVRPSRLDPLMLLALKALALDDPGPTAGPRTPGQTLDQLNGRLQVGSQVLGQLLRKLEAEGLAQVAANGARVPTALGRRALEQGEYLRDEYERRVFYFLERGPAAKPPYFVNFPPHLASPWPAAEGWVFDVRVLEASAPAAGLEAAAPLSAGSRGSPRPRPAGRGETGLPAERGPAPRALEPWQQVILDRPEQLLTVLVLTAGESGGERLLGFTIQQDGWVLKSTEPAFVVNADWQEVLGAAAISPPLEQWWQAWRNWCRPRAVPLADADACALAHRDHRLQVLAPPRLLERLRASRSDALRGEAWVLAGEGHLRAAALLEIVETRPAPEPAPSGAK